jgi:predicted RNA binding protein YcfA (HicA-like mRNA interferase family)
MKDEFDVISKDELEPDVVSVSSKGSHCMHKNTAEDELEPEVVSVSSKGSHCVHKNTAEDELDVKIVPSKNSHGKTKNIMKDEIHKDKPIILQDHTGDENVPASKCYYN